MFQFLFVEPWCFLYYLAAGLFFSRIWWKVNGNQIDGDLFLAICLVFLWPAWVLWRVCMCIGRLIFDMADWVAPKLSNYLTGK